MLGRVLGASPGLSQVGETPLLLCDTQTCPPRGQARVPEVPCDPRCPADPTGP